jgi:hypothetical protein
MARRWDRAVRHLYVRWIRPRVDHAIVRQRIKLLYFGWSYVPILFMTFIPRRLALVAAFLATDWTVPAAHRPSEIAAICHAFRHVAANTAMVEAGCWQGASSVKFSHLCARFGLRLHIYDSFEGVETVREGGYNFSGEYASPESVLREHLRRRGVSDVCEVHPGWFSETLAKQPPSPVSIAYVDCDIAKGTQDALSGIVQALAPHGIVYTQDFHVASVRRLLADPSTWRNLGCAPPIVRRLAGNLAMLTFPERDRRRT